MKIHYLQHVSFEGIGHIQSWADANGHEVTKTKLFNNEQPPAFDSYDLLIIMGGPMGIYDYEDYLWLKSEKRYIKDAIDSGKTILGICLGAQLIADVLGATITAGNNKEIGWFPIDKTPDANSTQLGSLLPDEILAYHWHGDTFQTPEGAQRLFFSEACANQAFVYDERVIALQFHLETTAGSMQALIDNCGDEITTAPYIQTAEAMTLNSDEKITSINEVMEIIMNYLIQL